MGVFYHCGSWSKAVLYMYVSHFYGKVLDCGDCVSTIVSGLPLFLSFPDSLEILGLSAFFFFTLELFLVTAFKSCCSSPGRELHIPVTLCWLFCSGCLFVVFGSLMNNRHGHTLGCCSGLLFIVGSLGSGGRWNSSERTYTYMWKAGYMRPTEINLIILILMGRSFQFLTLQNANIFLVFQQLLVD